MSTASDSRFPPELLAAPLMQRYEYFANWRVSHPKLVQAKEELLHALRYPGDCRVIHVFGCTGVGKSTLRRWSEKLLHEEMRLPMERDPDLMPVVSVVTPSPDQGPFNWRDVYIQTMHALGEPKALIRQKRANQLPFRTEDKLAVAPILPRQELRLALAGCLHMRGVDILFYDDAQHFQMVSKAQRLQDQMDNLKWMADITTTKIVLVGTYDLLNLVDLSGQLARRSTNIHFARYHADRQEEFQQFANIVYTFQQHLPLAEEPKLVDQTDYLYERCIGCVGLLKDWLVRALSQALTSGEQTLTAKRLEACVDVRKLIAVAKEAIAGEQRIRAVADLHVELQGLLKSTIQIPVTVRPEQAGVTKQSKDKPGQRKAKRDLVADQTSEVR